MRKACLLETKAARDGDDAIFVQTRGQNDVFRYGRGHQGDGTNMDRYGVKGTSKSEGNIRMVERNTASGVNRAHALRQGAWNGGTNRCARAGGPSS
jgi:hypothetical protein